MTERPKRNAAPRAGRLRQAAALPVRARARGLPEQDVHEILLVLRGDSVIDWHRLALTDEADAKRLLRVNGVDLDRDADVQRLHELREQAVRYVGEDLGLRVDPVLSSMPPHELLLLASGQGALQRSACTLLKVMHIIYHLDAREMLTALAIPDSIMFEKIEQRIAGLFDELRTQKVPVLEFAWSRKTRQSLITKLLVKRETSAARVFDRLRFRLIVEGADDVVPTLGVMLHRFIPFNYVLPGQTVNTLVDTSALAASVADRGVLTTVVEDAPQNEFSDPTYHVLNFVADLPVHVGEVLQGTEYASAAGSLVFVLAEFQIMDRATAEANERGESSHEQYKRRQHLRVRERLLREPRGGSGKKTRA